MRVGLAPKLILSLTTIVVIVEGVFGVVNARIQEKQLLEEVVLGADRLSNTITSATWQAMLADHRESAYEVMRTIGRQEGIRRVRIFNKLGRIMFSTGPDRGQLIDKTAEACYMCHAAGEPLVKVNAPSRVRTFFEGEQRFMGMVTPIYNEPACESCHPGDKQVLGVLDISVPLTRLDEEVSGIRLRAILVGAVSVLLIGAFVVFFTRRFVLRPVRELIAGTKKVAALELERPVEVRSRDELGDLGSSFNRMREHLLEARREIGDFTRNLEAKVEERTEQLREAQQELMQADRLASLGRLAASVAHEINNPLSAVLNFSMLMRRLLREDGIPEDRIEDFRRYLDQVAGETRRAGKIATDLLSFSRRAQNPSEPVDLTGTVRQTLAVLAHELEPRGVAAELMLSEDLPPVEGDGSRIQQVVTNLVTNAADAMPGGGVVRITTRYDAAAGQVLLQVADQGQGIPAENLSRIFDPFFTTKEVGKGVGLGLAVVYGIIEIHGGTIDVDSRRDEGTTFTVRLPAGTARCREENRERTS